MHDPAFAPPPAAYPPPKKSGPLKWILIGCGSLTAVGILCFGGCFAMGYYAVQRAGKEIAPAGEAYLRSQSEIEDELGKLTKVEYKPLAGTNIHVEGSTGKARLGYTIEGPKGKGEATVWFEKEGGQWKAVGCEVTTPSGRTIKIGRSFDIPSNRSRGGRWDD